MSISSDFLFYVNMVFWVHLVTISMKVSSHQMIAIFGLLRGHVPTVSPMARPVTDKYLSLLGERGSYTSNLRLYCCLKKIKT